jgi:hypothetical protein
VLVHGIHGQSGTYHKFSYKTHNESGMGVAFWPFLASFSASSLAFLASFLSSSLGKEL